MTEIIAGKKRMIALVTAAVLLAVLILAFTFAVNHLNHECTGKDCPVCAEIAACVAVIRLITEAVVPGAAVIIVYMIIQKILISDLAGFKLCPVSLVSLKIRLDD